MYFPGRNKLTSVFNTKQNFNHFWYAIFAAVAMTIFMSPWVLSVLFQLEDDVGYIYLSRLPKDVRNVETHAVSFENPYVYPGRVDLRVIVITYARSRHLLNLLLSLRKLELDGSQMAIEIWIDCNENDQVVRRTFEVSRNFSRTNNYTTVHVHRKHAGLHNQWISTYSTKHLKEGEREMVLFLEDDLLISRYGYRWLKAVHEHFRDVPSFLGASLISRKNPIKLKLPAHHAVFMHRTFENHAFSPKLEVWTKFQKWFVDHYGRGEFKPYVPDISATMWFKSFESSNLTHTMWTIWFLYYAYVEQLYAVYVNPLFLAERSNVTRTTLNSLPCLGIHTEAKGLHSTWDQNVRCPLLDKWSEDYVCFPKNLIKLGRNGFLEPY